MRRGMTAIAALVVAILATGIARAQSVPDPVAIVSYQNAWREQISRQEFLRELLRRNGAYVLQQLSLEALVSKGAQDAGVVATDDEVESRIEQIAQEKGLRTPSLQQAHLRGLYPALDVKTAQNRWREDTRLQLLIEKIVAKTQADDVEVTDADIQQFWENYSDTSPLVNRPQGRRVSIIITEDLEEAKHAHSRVTNFRGQWHEVCRKYSVDPLSKHKGGDYGPYVRVLPGQEPGRFEKEVFKLKKVGDISDVVHMPPWGYVILRLDEIQRAERFELDEVKEDIRDNLRLLKVRRQAQIWMTQAAWENADFDVKIEFETETGVPEADPVATINGLTVSRDDFTRELVRRNGPKLLRQLVLERVIQKHAEAAGIEVSDDEVRQRLQEVAKPHSLPAYRAFLAERYPGLDFASAQERFEEDTRMELMVEKIVAQEKIEVSNVEVRDFYEKYKDTSPLISRPEARRVSVIVTEELAEAKKALAELRAAPENWGSICRKYSKDAFTRDRGGDFGRYLDKPRPADQPDDFLREVFKLAKPGETSGIVTPPWGGQVIIRLDDVRPGQKLPYGEEAKQIIRAELLAAKIQRKAARWINQEAWEGVKLDIKIKFGDA